MAETKVCLVTGAAGYAGQKILSTLVKNHHKVLALGEPEDTLSFDVLKKSSIKVTTALPVTAASFKKHDVQFCFGDIGDISFLASIFASAKENGINIEYAVYLSANAVLQKASPNAYHPDFAAAANMLEVTAAYWQSNKQTFKGFLYASDGNKKSLKAENMLSRLVEKENFPAVIHKPEVDIASNYKGKTQLSMLYRLIAPFGAPAMPIPPQSAAVSSEEMYINSLSREVLKMVGAKPEK